MSSRRFTVTQRNGAGKVITEVKYTATNQALEQFQRCLRGAGHDERKVEHFMRVWTYTLMQGAQGYEVLDPGLDGSISITITVEPGTTVKE